MTQQTYTIPSAIKGDTYIGVEFTVEVNDSPVDLTGASIRMKLKREKNKTSQSYLTLDTDEGLTITDAENGVFTIDSQIIDIDPFNYFYDIEITLSSEAVKTYITGTWEILQDATT